MAKKTADYLKLVACEPQSDAPALAPTRSTSEPQFATLARAFESATGWQISYVDGICETSETWSAPVDGGDGEPVGRLVLAADPDKKCTVSWEHARPLALAIAGMLSQQNKLRRALWQREAELAAGVPIANRGDEKQHLAERLATVLQSGAEAVGCSAAGLYLLDEATTSLKLRASYGLPTERLLEPARPLRGSVAELEALLGHAVVLEDTSLLPHWRVPESYAAAVCVPVSSSTMPLGTLWIYCDHCRDFSSQETNLLEIVAGRIAAELEREMLLTVNTEAKKQDREYAAATRWQNDRLPSVMPLVDDFELAGWTQQAQAIGGDFYDWSVLPDGRLAVSVGDAQGKLAIAGLNAAALQAAVKSHACYRHHAAEMLARVNETLWSASAGDQFASLFYGLIDPAAGTLEFALAGTAAGILVRSDSREILTTAAPMLGKEPELSYGSTQQLLLPGDFLILLSEGARQAVDEAGLRVGESAIAALVAKHRRNSAENLLAELRRLLDSGTGSQREDMTLLVIKRRNRRA